MSEAIRPYHPAQITYLDPSDLIPNPRNPRTALGELDELTASIKEAGVLEPLIVAPSEVGGYLVLFGHRRRQAASTPALPPCPASSGTTTPLRTPSRWPTCSPRIFTG